MKKPKQRNRIGARVRNLISRRSFLGAASSTAASLSILSACGSEAAAKDSTGNGPLIITKQGSFLAGGSSVTAPGTFDPNHPRTGGDTYYIDHLYAQFQIPQKPRKFPLIMTHGINGTGRNWESTPDGREGFQSIFLRRGFAVYLVDSPRRGRAGFPSFNGPLGNLGGKQLMPDTTSRLSAQQTFILFRLGLDYPNFFPNSAFPKDGLEQFLRQFIPMVTDDPDVVSDSFVALLDKIGPSIMIPHSQSGPFAMLAAIKSPNVKAICTYEPAGVVFPAGDARSPIVLSDGSPRTTDREVPLSDFMKLTKIPIQLVFCDNIPTDPHPLAMLDLRRVQVLAAKQFVEAINRHGGDASYLSLPEVGLQGNSHYPFIDLNNVQVADWLSKFLHEKGLDHRG